MKYKSIIIVTYGRTGSTLLQGIVNQIPGCVVRGENYNFIYKIYEAYKKLQHAKKMESEENSKYNTPQHSWYGASQFDLELFINSQKEMIKKLLIGDSSAQYYGFKEIRYFGILDELEEFIQFLELVMEDVAIVFNVRNSSDVANSSWWKETNKTKLIPKLDRIQNEFKTLAQKKENSFYFDYDELMQDSMIVQKLYEFLDVAFDVEKIKTVLSIEHSQDNKRNTLNAILLPKKSLGYCFIPKTACTSIKQALYKLRTGQDFNRKKVGKTVHNYFQEEYKDISKAKFKFIVVRDPVKRFLSAYSNRVTHHKELSTEYLEKRKNGQKLLEKKVPTNPNIDQFFEFFYDYITISVIDHHTKPMYTFLQDNNLDFFDKVYKIETIDQLTHDVEQFTNKEFKLPRAQTGGKKVSVSSLSQEQIEFLLEYYKKDYEVLEGYYSKEDILNEWQKGKEENLSESRKGREELC